MDRNPVGVNAARVASLSLSARRAWIEIRNDTSNTASPVVALRKESVDRNMGAS